MAKRTVPDLTFLLMHAGHVLNTEMTSRLAALETTPRAHCVLAFAMEGEFTQGQLAEKCGLDKTTMVVTLDALEKSRLAERRLSRTDRRARIIAVTDEGRELVGKGVAIADEVHGDVLASLPEGIREVFRDALVTLVKGRLATPVPSDVPIRRRGR